MTLEGEGSWVVGGERVKTGFAAARVTPGTSDFYGISWLDLGTAGAAQLAVDVFLEGTRPATFRIRADDPKSGRGAKDALIRNELLNPGWNRIDVPLVGMKTGDGRDLDFSATVRRLQVSKRKEADDAALVGDGVFLVGAKDAPKAPLLAALAAEKDGAKRARLLREGLDALSEPDRVAVAVGVLKNDRHARARRAAREALAGCGADGSVAAVQAAMKGATAPDRPELAWALAAMPNVAARAAAEKLAVDPKADALDRTAAVTGLASAAAAPSITLVAAAKAAPWSIRAALVAAYRKAGLALGADGLIALLEGETAPRIIGDAADALAHLSGTDLGVDAAAWKRWWEANRGKTGARKPATTKYGTGRFYGITVPPGRTAFVLDTSGSMREPVVGGPAAKWVAEAPHLKGKTIKTRLDLAAEELAHALDSLGNGATVGVIAYSESAQWISKGYEPLDAALRDKLSSRVRALTAARKTNIYDGLNLAFRPQKKTGPMDTSEGPDTLFLLSDGNPSTGKIEDIQELRDEVLAWNLGRSIRIHCVNVGDADARLLRALASSSGGTYLDLKSDRPEPPDEEPKK